MPAMTPGEDQSEAGNHRDRVLSEGAPDAFGIRLLSLIGLRRLAVGFSILWNRSRLLGPDVGVLSQGGVGRICGPLLG